MAMALTDVEDAWREHEENMVFEMSMLGKRLLRRPDGQVDVASPAGRDAAHMFLRCVDNVAHVLQLQLVPRTYRQCAPESVFPQWFEHGSIYGIRILVVSVQHRRDIILNNQVFPLSERAVSLSLRLSHRWATIGLLLEDLWKHGPPPVPRSKVLATLETFDRAWAAFEQVLLSELWVMQSEAQHPLASLVRPTEWVCNLQRIYERFCLESQVELMLDDPEYQEQRRLLVKTFWRLKLAINPQNMGRCFTVQTLIELEAVIEQCEMDQPDPLERCQNPSFILAADAVEAFNDLCAYFCKLKDCMDRVHPDVCQNKGLVERLSRWEACWRRAADHVLDPIARQALETLVAHVREAQTLSPKLVEMCEECSADVFLALPRLVWLSFLAWPVDLAPEVQCLLPHHFVEMWGADDRLGCKPGDELCKLLEEYRRVVDHIAWAIAIEALESPQVQARVVAVGLEEARRELAAGLLSQRAVDGSWGDLEQHAIMLKGPEGVEAREACETFVRGLESWSTELHRHCARDWNTFVAMLLRCLNADLPPLGGAAGVFQV